MNEQLLSGKDLKTAHCGILVPDSINKQNFIARLFSEETVKGLESYQGLSGLVFSTAAMEQHMYLEDRHDEVRVAVNAQRKLKSFSSGERKKVFLKFCLAQAPDFLVLDNPFDHLDPDSRKELSTQLGELSEKILILQLATRQADLLPFIRNHKQLTVDGQLLRSVKSNSRSLKSDFHMPASESHVTAPDILVDFRGVSVSYGDRHILNDIHWCIKKGEFWQLKGPNGSGKTTLLDSITGENTKGYGQELYVFGRKKGSGESIWDLRKKIGYFSPAMVELFQRNTSVTEMLLSGFYDSVGLYHQPTREQERQAQKYLELAGMQALEKDSFHSLSVGQQRVVLILRAIVKQPPLLILDEPTEGMDDRNVDLVVRIVNLLAHRTESSILLVSHRREPELRPSFMYELLPGKNGSTGRVLPGRL